MNKYTRINFNVNFLKTIAMLCVICAHLYVVDRKSLNGLIAAFGLVGVPLFLLISGLKFHRQENEVFLKYLFKLLVPWIFMGTVVYILSSLFGQIKADINFDSWFVFIIGIDTYLWFMPILFFCKTYFQIFSSSIISCLVIIIISILSLLLTENYKLVFLNPYLNVFNWIGWFAFGIIINKLSLIFNKIYNGFLLILLLISTLYISFQNLISYFSSYSLFFELVTILVLLNFSTYKVLDKFLPEFGEQSFAIYLFHMPIVGLINLSFNYYNLNNFVFLKLIIVIIIIYVILRLLKYLSCVELCKPLLSIMGYRFI